MRSREHLAADLVLALAHLDGLLARRLADHVAAWQPPPATLALRQPCPHRTDPDGCAMSDLLLVRPDPADDPDDAFDAHVAALVAALPHWTGNPVHDHVLAGPDAGDHDELADASWWLLAGRRVPGLAFTDPPQPPNPEVSRPAGLSAPTPQQPRERTALPTWREPTSCDASGYALGVSFSDTISMHGIDSREVKST